MSEHPAANLFPMLSADELTALADDIRAHGLRDPIELLDGAVIDGRNRLAACQMAGVEPRFVDVETDNPIAYVVSKNLHRRHLNEGQRSSIAARLAAKPLGSNQHSSEGAQICAPSQAEAAGLLNVSRRSVQSAAAVHAQGVPELVAAVDSGTIAVSAAAKLAERPPDVQRAAVAEGPVAVREAARPVEPEPSQEQQIGAFADRIIAQIEAAKRAGLSIGVAKRVIAYLEELPEASVIFEQEPDDEEAEVTPVEVEREAPPCKPMKADHSTSSLIVLGTIWNDAVESGRLPLSRVDKPASERRVKGWNRIAKDDEVKAYLRPADGEPADSSAWAERIVDAFSRVDFAKWPSLDFDSLFEECAQRTKSKIKLLMGGSYRKQSAARPKKQWTRSGEAVA